MPDDYYSDQLVFTSLCNEWHTIVRRIPLPYRQWMRCPQFALNPNMHCWGQWTGHPVNRIELSRKLLVEHPWYALSDVLAHETAHQLCDLIRTREGRGAGESAHGALFRECCRYTGARPAASDDFPLLSDLIFAKDGTAENAEENAPAIAKIQKLLALSHSPNQAEAETALLKARELSAKYDIELNQISSGGNRQETTFHTISIGREHSRLRFEDYLCANILTEFFKVYCYWGWVAFPPPPPGGQPKRLLFIGGTAGNLRIASYVYDCVQRYLEKAVYDQPASILSRLLTRKRSLEDFRIGILQGFMGKLREQNSMAVIQQAQAIIIADRARLAEYIRRTNPGMRTAVKSSTRQIDREIRKAGCEAGKRLNLHPGLDPQTATAEERRSLLPPDCGTP